jgi:alkylhydroperoxidase/carboxymuconolactone decarboxylase family protein YurZ
MNKPLSKIDQYKEKGDWNQVWSLIEQKSPEFLEAYLAFRDVPHQTTDIPAKYRELILVAINVATTHLYGPGTKRHIENAKKHGATEQEVLQTIQMVSIMGIHSCNLGYPLVSEIYGNSK